MMLTVNEAITQLLAVAEVRSTVESMPVVKALGCILAEDINAYVNVPPADNSAMDGYAFNFKQAINAGFKLPVSQKVPAGTPPEPLLIGSAARVFTGAEIPLGADSVAPQEICFEKNGILFLASDLTPSCHIRKQGQDTQAGSLLLSAGSPIGPAQMGLLASQGIVDVTVYKPLRVAIFSTGDELVEPGTALQSGQIYNSNRALLIGLIKSIGMQAIDLGVINDDLDATKNAFLGASEHADIIISAGGVSVGEEDYVKQAVADIGSVDFWRVAIKPGKPIAFGSVNQCPFIGLPGNPASVFVTFMVLVRPFLLASQGCSSVVHLVAQSRAMFSKASETREVYLRCRLVNNNGIAGVELHPNQSSGVLSSTAWGNVLVRQQSDVDIQVNDLVDVLLY